MRHPSLVEVAEYYCHLWIRPAVVGVVAAAAEVASPAALDRSTFSLASPPPPPPPPAAVLPVVADVSTLASPSKSIFWEMPPLPAVVVPPTAASSLLLAAAAVSSIPVAPSKIIFWEEGTMIARLPIGIVRHFP